MLWEKWILVGNKKISSSTNVSDEMNADAQSASEKGTYLPI
jgi:hypothetical protein